MEAILPSTWIRGNSSGSTLEAEQASVFVDAHPAKAWRSTFCFQDGDFRYLSGQEPPSWRSGIRKD
jgi:hypothetical protein